MVTTTMATKKSRENSKKITVSVNSNSNHVNQPQIFQSFFMSRGFELFVCGYLVLSSVLDQYFSYIRHGEISFLWFCTIAALILAVALYLQNRIWMSAILVLAIPAQFLWISDFFLHIFGIGLGRTAQLFDFGTDIFLTSLNLHIILIPIALFATWKYGFEFRSFWYGFLFFVLLLCLSFVLTDPLDNVNCVFYSCDELQRNVYSREEYVPYFLLYLFGCVCVYFVSFFSNNWFWQKVHFESK
jgi:hypothetical protein